MYILMEHVPGGDFFTRLESCAFFVPENEARFYCANIILAVEFLHSIHGRLGGIVYRDLKPENLIVAGNGYLKLVDFGFSKELLGASRTFTLCGTPEYLAPETILGRGYSFPVDWWALGVLLYDASLGSSPFAEAEDYDQMSICRNIIQKRVRFPRFCDPQLKGLIKRLLKKDPLKRLGSSTNGAKEIKSNEWFAEIDWRALYREEVEAPWIPPPWKEDAEESSSSASSS